MQTEKPNFKFSPDLYDEQVNWENRFKVEKDFFYQLFKSNDVKKVLDIGCGTGRHAQLFSSFVDEVYAMDPSHEMINYAKEKVITSENIKLMYGGFNELSKIKENNFDAITCLGNTLPVLETRKKVKNALKITRKKLKKGGIAVFQFINFEKDMIEKNRYYQPKVLHKENKTFIFNRHFEYDKLKTRVDFIVTILNYKNEIETFDVDTTMMCTLKTRIFNKMALNSGFKKIKYFGNNTNEIFNKTKHISLFALLKA
ncbi:MAG: class I SAM-dependent methyltransferase [Actinobacteria bacterium]|nr:class I SAM-dependent methyltransferase [Actinomycetota bacterium]